MRGKVRLENSLSRQEGGWQGHPPSCRLKLFSSQTFPRINTTTFLKPSSFYTQLPAYEDGTECSETSAYKIQTPGNYPEESIQSEHGESLK